MRLAPLSWRDKVRLRAILVRRFLSVVAVSYSRKVQILMEELGCPELCLELESVTPGTLEKIRDDAIARRVEIVALESKTVAEWKNKIDQQYLDFLSLLD